MRKIAIHLEYYVWPEEFQCMLHACNVCCAEPVLLATRKEIDVRIVLLIRFHDFCSAVWRIIIDHKDIHQDVLPGIF